MEGGGKCHIWCRMVISSGCGFSEENLMGERLFRS